MGGGPPIPMRTRTHSNGYSDPGTATTSTSTATSTSAFHAWSCRSLYCNQSGTSREDVGSDVGSAISSSVACGGQSTSNSDPFPDRSSSLSSLGVGMIKHGEFTSPWRRVMNRMKKTTNGRVGGGRNKDSSSSAGEGNRSSRSGSTGRPSLGRTLSGRENPARPDLSDDDDSPPSQGAAVFMLPAADNNNNNANVEVVSHDPGETPASSVSVGGSKGTASSKKKKKKNRKKKKSKKSSTPYSSSGGSKAAVTLSMSTKGNSMTNVSSSSSSGLYDSTKSMNIPAMATTTTTAMNQSSSERQYDDPGVALDLSDNSDTDDDRDGTKPPVGCDVHSRSFTHNNIVPPSQLGSRIHDPKPPLDQCDDGIEVISTTIEASASSRMMMTIMDSESSVLGTFRIYTPITPIDENSPPSVERLTNILDDIKSDDTPVHSSLHHPFGCGGVKDDDVPDDEFDDSFTVDERQNSVPKIQFAAGSTPQAKLKYRSPQRFSSSPYQSSSLTGSVPSIGGGDHRHSPSSYDSRLSSLGGGSPSSRISSSNSRTTASTLNSVGDRTINTLRSIDGSLVMDNEIREANRRTMRSWRRSVGGSGASVGGGGDETNHQEAMVGPDGNDTVFSSSTTSSNYHAYFSSPKPLRDGATMPVDRFFAGGNVPMSPSPPRDKFAAVGTVPSMSKFFCPKTLSRTITRDSTHSPHTISSASVSATSSSGSETKRPLQFVAYQIREERESPFDEPPGYSHITTYATYAGANVSCDDSGKACSPLIKPRISKADGTSTQQHLRRPPMIQRPPAACIMQVQTKSPRKQKDSNTVPYGRSRTPTRTPPPLSYMPSSAANTPCSPLVFIDGPSNVEALCVGDASAPTRPYVVRRSEDVGGINSGEGGMILVQPTISRLVQQHNSPLQPCTKNAAAGTTCFPSGYSYTVVTPSDNNDVVRNTIVAASRGGNLDTVEETAASTVTPERFPFPNTVRRINLIAPKSHLKVVLGEDDSSSISVPEKNTKARGKLSA